MAGLRHEAIGKAGRLMAALLGGYLFACAWAVFVAAVLPLPRPQAVLMATLTSFAAFLAIIILSFAFGSIWRWLMILSVMTLALAGSGLALSEVGA